MKNLPRWIFASLADHFKVVAATIPLTYFVEGVDEREPTTMRQNHCEFRTTGPFIKEVGNGTYKVEVVVNIMLTNLMEMSGEDAYAIVQWAGTFQEALLQHIPVYKYGTGAEDDSSLIGCLFAKAGAYEAVRVYHFGQIDKTDRVRQSEVDAVLEMWVTESDL